MVSFAPQSALPTDPVALPKTGQPHTHTHTHDRGANRGPGIPPPGKFGPAKMVCPGHGPVSRRGQGMITSEGFD